MNSRNHPRYRPQLDVLEDRFAPAAPTRVEPPSTLPEPFLLPAGTCPFPVQVTFLADKEKTTTFSDKDGNQVRSIQTGTLKVQLTNLDTGQTLNLNISGPQVSYPDGTSITRGPWLFFFPPDNTQGQEAGLILIHGRTEYTADSFSVLSGNVQDVCAALDATSAS